MSQWESLQRKDWANWQQSFVWLTQSVHAHSLNDIMKFGDKESPLETSKTKLHTITVMYTTLYWRQSFDCDAFAMQMFLFRMFEMVAGSHSLQSLYWFPSRFIRMNADLHMFSYVVFHEIFCLIWTRWLGMKCFVDLKQIQNNSIGKNFSKAISNFKISHCPLWRRRLSYIRPELRKMEAIWRQLSITLSVATQADWFH